MTKRTRILTAITAIAMIIVPSQALAAEGYWIDHDYDDGWAAIYYNSDGTIGKIIGYSDGYGYYEQWYSCCY